MKRSHMFLMGCLMGCLGVLATADAASAHNVRWSIGVNLGPPPIVVGPRPYCPYRPYYPYYPYPRPVYYEPAPVIVRPAPVIYEPAPIVVPAPAASAPAPVPARTISAASLPAVVDVPTNIDAQLHLLRNPDENVRADAALDLGRSRSERAVDPLAATLAGDKSASVRDAAARALGLLGSPRGLTALTHAAAGDSDRDVRRSAQFSVEVIQSRRD